MGRRAAIGIHDDLAAGQTGISVGSADHEAAGRIHVELFLRAHPAFGQHVDHVWPHDLPHVVLIEVAAVLGRDDDRGGAHRLAVLVGQGDLTLGIRAEARLGTRVPRFGKGFQDVVAQVNRRRHEVFGLVAGEAEHDALVAGTFVLVPCSVDADRNVCGLIMDVVLERQVLPVKALLLVSDFPNRVARHVFQHILGDLLGPANLAGEHDTVGRCHRLDGDPRQGVVREEGVDDSVRDAIANLVGVPFRDGLAGEVEVAGTHVSFLRCLDPDRGPLNVYDGAPTIPV